MVNAERMMAGPPKPASTVTVGELLDTWLTSKASLVGKSLEAA